MSWLNRLFPKDHTGAAARLADGVEVKWDGHFWAGETVLPAWAGFQERSGIYSGRSSAKPSDGKVLVSVRTATDANNPPTLPTKEQELAFHFLRDNGELLRDKVTKAIFDEYPKLRDTFADLLGEDLETTMPALRDPSDLKRLIGLSTVHISSEAKDGIAYVGFELGCDWEKEHGLGVITHKDRIIEVGDSETAFDAWRLRRGEIS
jgi:hypothetical protein